MDHSASQAPASPTAYRPDIDGLRAIAVLGVIVYHLPLPYIAFPGGFTGVDVFFVISGYLITQILLKGRGQPGYLRTFYVRRFRRILPAFLAMIGFCLVAGYVLLGPGDYDDLGKSARYSLFALSNLFFYQNTGYFDQVAELMPLLHTWSLAVEEQFYLVWPLLLLVGVKARREMSLLLLCCVVVLSFAYSVEVVSREPKAGFYGPLARAWELGVGGLLAFLPGLRLRRIACESLDLLGIALIGYSFGFLSDDVAFPGVNALYACLGSALILLPKSHVSRVGAVLSSKPFRAIGLISYSLYLWHWPLLVFTLHFSGGALNALSATAVLVASFAVAALSWRFVEQPFRGPRLPQAARATRTSHAPLAAAAMLLLTVSAAGITMTDGVRDRLPAKAIPLSDLDLMWMWQPQQRFAEPSFPGYIVFGAPWEEAQYRIVLWGDSHAAHLAPLLEASLSHANAKTSVLLYRSCPANVDGQRIYAYRQDAAYNEKCAEDRNKMLRFLEHSTPAVDRVILAASWMYLVPGLTADRDLAKGMQLWRASMRGTLDEIIRRVPGAVLVGQVPVWNQNPLPCAFATRAGLYRGGCDSEATTLRREEVRDLYFAVDRALAELAGGDPRVTAYLASEHMCSEAWCLSSIDGEFLYRDKGHLRRNLPFAIRTKLAKHMRLERMLPPFLSPLDGGSTAQMVAIETSR